MTVLSWNSGPHTTELHGNGQGRAGQDLTGSGITTAVSMGIIQCKWELQIMASLPTFSMLITATLAVLCYYALTNNNFTY